MKNQEGGQEFFFPWRRNTFHSLLWLLDERTQFFSSFLWGIPNFLSSNCCSRIVGDDEYNFLFCHWKGFDPLFLLRTFSKVTESSQYAKPHISLHCCLSAVCPCVSDVCVYILNSLNRCTTMRSEMCECIQMKDVLNQHNVVYATTFSFQPEVAFWFSRPLMETSSFQKSLWEASCLSSTFIYTWEYAHISDDVCLHTLHCMKLAHTNYTNITPSIRTVTHGHTSHLSVWTYYLVMKSLSRPDANDMETCMISPFLVWAMCMQPVVVFNSIISLDSFCWF